MDPDNPCDNCRACMAEYFNSPPPVPFDTCAEARAAGMSRAQQEEAEHAAEPAAEPEVGHVAGHAAEPLSTKKQNA